MQTRDVMSSPVISLRPQVPVHVAAAQLASHGFTAAPVMDAEGHLLGIATEVDLLRGWVAAQGCAVVEGPEPTVASVMTPVPIAVRPDDDLADLLSLMHNTPVRSVPIVDDGRLVGIVTRRDLLRVMAGRELTSEDVRRRRSGLPTRAPERRPPQTRPARASTTSASAE